LIAVFVTVALLLIAGGFVLVSTKGNSETTSQSTQSNDSSTPNETSSSDVIYEKVSKHIILPKDENPTIVPVTNKAELGDEELFKNVQNGDIFLVFTNSKLAVVYRESEDKIVTVSGLDLTSQPQTTQ